MPRRNTSEKGHNQNVLEKLIDANVQIILSKKGIEKILIYINNNINIEYEKMICDCYLNIDLFNFYSIHNEKQVFI